MNNLYEVEREKSYRIQATPDMDQLESIGVISGSIVEKIRTYGGGGPTYIALGTRRIAIGKNIAKEIQVEEVNDGNAGR